jgi:hypothetical protein
MKKSSQALMKESAMETAHASKNKKDQKVSSTNHVQKIKPIVVVAPTPNDPGCRPTGT